MANNLFFQWTSIYGEFLENEIAPLLQHEPFCFFERSFIQYQSLKKSLLDIETFDCNLFETNSAVSASNIDDDCCICLEPFDHRANLVVTKCKHCFHSPCLLKLIDHAKRRANAPISCPLCRSPNICLDTRRDRAIVDFARAMESNLRATERCHLSLMRHVQLRLHMLTHEATTLPSLSRLFGGPRLRAVRTEAAALRNLLRAAALLAAAGRDGFRALLRELDARCAGSGPVAAAAARRARAAARRFAAKSAPGGPIEAAIAAIAALGLRLKPPPTLPALPVLPALQPEPGPELPFPQPAAPAAQPAPRAGLAGLGGDGSLRLRVAISRRARTGRRGPIATRRAPPGGPRAPARPVRSGSRRGHRVRVLGPGPRPGARHDSDGAPTPSPLPGVSFRPGDTSRGNAAAFKFPRVAAECARC
jgi:hypothetical protein